MTVNVKRDDGVVVYLNGSELFRDNLPDGTITYTTFASSPTENNSFPNIAPRSMNVDNLFSGTNVLAVEIHQSSGGSSDISFDLRLIASTEATTPTPTGIVRGPYLQNATPQSVTIMWRTSENTSSKVWYGTSLTTLDQTAEDSNLKTDHTMRISGLNPDTKYYYLVGSIDEAVLAGGDPNHYFVTSPTAGSTDAVRIWVLGDSGTANNNARAVKNAYLELADNEEEADIWLMLGDNAYTSGTDAEYQNAVFNMYPEILRNKVLWPTRGNHEMSSTVYYGIFDLPANGEGGGLASGTEHYYSFDYANIHFICLNSQESGLSGSPGSAMYQWLEEDLANTQQEWIVTFWHHPPYTKGSHDSDTESKLISMRENALPILEAGGVDLVLAGHSHSYERSLFINGHYAHSSSFNPGVHVVQAGSSREDGDGAYVKAGDDGTVYIVAGSSGKLGGGSMDHPVMYFSERQFGSLIIDVQGGRMDARFLREYTNPTQVDDYFTIQGTSLTAMLVGPADGLTDVPPRGVVLRWIPGEYADEHDVYFGDNFDDVNNATATIDPGGVYLGRQNLNYYPINGALDLGKTYYWRVDEVNAPPDSTVYPGEVWSFTIEPVGYPIDGANITATASSSSPGQRPEDTVNGSGLSDDLHARETETMWLSGFSGPQPTWIQFEFDKVYLLHEMWVWNSNIEYETDIGYGFRDVTIEYSADGIDYVTLGTTHEFSQGPGEPDYAHNTTVDLGGITAKYVRLTANSNWGGQFNLYGLSEVRFLHIPVRAREPHPDSGATDVDVDVTLGWRAGRQAAEHNVYVSTDEQAVTDGTAPVTVVTETSHSPSSLDMDSTYYWRVDEVNDAETPETLPGDIWSFSTREYLVVDDIEDYNDFEPDRIFDTWIHGWGVATNGSQVGYTEPPFVEKTIVHGGYQSMPLFYSNTGGAIYSEGTRTFAVPQDWTKHGVQTLVLYFHGTAGNTGQLYVKINGVKIPYDSAAGNLAISAWQLWNIDLTSSGLNLQSVSSLAIGIDGNGASGTLYFDDIRLYALAPAPVSEWRIAAGSDDAEEFVLDGGRMQSLTSTDLELGYEYAMVPASLQTIGCRWVGVPIPKGATITEAWVQFSANDIGSSRHIPDVSVIIEGELSADPATFSSTPSNISSRPKTTAQVVWDIPRWMTVHAKGPEEQTPDISSIIQEIVNQDGWAGQAIVLMFRDNPAKPSQGTREAESFNGNPSEAPLLHISYQ